MADTPPQSVSSMEEASVSAHSDSVGDRQSRKEAERDALAADTYQREATLLEDTNTLFTHLAAYLRGELSTTTAEYKLLESMNLVTKEKYEEMTSHAGSLVNNMKALQEKYAAFEPHLKKIDEIDASLTDLEKTLNALDAYTQRLENKFRYLKEHKQQPYAKLPPSHQI
jgi:biogenesis of lysosome-related organelles complex 1 subunit 2